MALDILRSIPQAQAVPADFQVPGAAEWMLKCITAVYDGTSAATPFLPALQIIGPGNISLGTFVDQNTTIAAGGSAEVTFGPFLGKRGGAGTVCSSYDDFIINVGAQACWPLSELSGTVAHDITGNGHHLGATTTSPAWASSIAPTGTPWPNFGLTDTFGDVGAAQTYSPTLTGDFTIGAWFQTPNPSGGTTNIMFRQGDPFGAHSGLRVGVDAANVNLGQRISLVVGTGVGGGGMQGDNVITAGVPIFATLRRSGTTFSLWVNGVQQSTTYSGAYVASNTNFVIGGTFTAPTQEAYVMYFPYALSASAIAKLYTAA